MRSPGRQRGGIASRFDCGGYSAGQAIAVTPAATVDEFILKKEVVVECVNKYANGPASTLVLMSLFQDFDRLTDRRRSTPALLNREYSETYRIVSARHTLFDESVFGVCQAFWIVWSGFTEILS